MGVWDVASVQVENKEKKMDTQNRAKSAGTSKFPKPRGWAMEWVFAQEAVPPTVEQGPEAGLPVFPRTGSPAEGNGGTGEKFKEPRGWAMKWDGLALSTTESGSSGQVPLR